MGGWVGGWLWLWWLFSGNLISAIPLQYYTNVQTRETAFLNNAAIIKPLRLVASGLKEFPQISV
jgi:hypothetical protein